MELISLIACGLLALVGSFASRQLHDEFKAWTPWIVDRLIERAVRKLPDVLQDRLREEWASHIHEVPGELGKILFAVSLRRVGPQLDEHCSVVDQLIAVAVIFCMLPLFFIVSLILFVSGDGTVFTVQLLTDGNKRIYFTTKGRVGAVLLRSDFYRLPNLLDVVIRRASLRVVVRDFWLPRK